MTAPQDFDWPQVSARIEQWRHDDEETRHYREVARALLDSGSYGTARLLCVSAHRTGWLWARRTVGYRAIVADSGLWGHGGTQPSPMSAVEAAVHQLYHTTTV